MKMKKIKEIGRVWIDGSDRTGKDYLAQRIRRISGYGIAVSVREALSGYALAPSIEARESWKNYILKRFNRETDVCIICTLRFYETALKRSIESGELEFLSEKEWYAQQQAIKSAAALLIPHDKLLFHDGADDDTDVMAFIQEKAKTLNDMGIE